MQQLNTHVIQHNIHIKYARYFPPHLPRHFAGKYSSCPFESRQYPTLPLSMSAIDIILPVHQCKTFWLFPAGALMWFSQFEAPADQCNLLQTASPPPILMSFVVNINTNLGHLHNQKTSCYQIQQNLILSQDLEFLTQISTYGVFSQKQRDLW